VTPPPLNLQRACTRARRRIYERIAVHRLGPVKADALLREPRAYIRDVLSLRHAKASSGRRFKAYTSALVHAGVLFWAADCTVAVAVHSYKVLRRPNLSRRRRAVLLARGAALHTARCMLCLLAGSLGGALGSLARPGGGTAVGQTLPELGVLTLLGPQVGTWVAAPLPMGRQARRRMAGREHPPLQHSNPPWSREVWGRRAGAGLGGGPAQQRTRMRRGHGPTACMPCW
jgi:hypothetical protein